MENKAIVIKERTNIPIGVYRKGLVNETPTIKTNPQDIKRASLVIALK